MLSLLWIQLNHDLLPLLQFFLTLSLLWAIIFSRCPQNIYLPL